MPEVYVLFGVALLLIIVALPLVKRKIKKNIWYGYRVSIYVFQDDEIWYRVNEIGGKHLILIGGWLALSALAVLIGGKESESIILPIMAIGLIAGIFASTIYAIFLAHRLAREKGLKK